MNHRPWLQSAIFLAVLCAALPSGAAPLDDAWLALHRKGDAAVHAGNLREAINAWREAWAIQPSADLACNLGRAELREGHDRAAAEWLTRCVRLSPKATEPSDLARLVDAVKERDLARARVAALTFDVDPGAEVFIDGVSVGQAPFEDPIFVEPTSHSIKAVLGARSTSRAIDAKPGAAIHVELPLPQEARPRPAALPPKEPRAIAPRAKAAPAAVWPIAVTASVAVAAGIAGGAFFAMSDAAHADARAQLKLVHIRTPDTCRNSGKDVLCSKVVSLNDQSNLYRNIGALMVTVAGASGAGSAALWLQRAGILVLPTIGASGVVVMGRW